MRSSWFEELLEKMIIFAHHEYNLGASALYLDQKLNEIFVSVMVGRVTNFKAVKT